MYYNNSDKYKTFNTSKTNETNEIKFQLLYTPVEVEEPGSTTTGWMPGTVVETLLANGIAVGSSHLAVSNDDVLASFDK